MSIEGEMSYAERQKAGANQCGFDDFPGAMAIDLATKKMANLQIKLIDTQRELAAAQAHESKELLVLAKLVADMRHAQLENAKTLKWNIRTTMERREQEVDKAIEAIFGDQQRPLL